MTPSTADAAAAAAPVAAVSTGKKNLIILFGIGGLSDVGRHAILAALEEPPSPNVAQQQIDKITVVTEYPELLDDVNWECGCPGGHPTNPVKTHPDRVKVVKVQPWNDHDNVDLLTQHLEDSQNDTNNTVIISCLGHRQPGWKYKQLIQRGLVASAGNRQLIQAITQHNNNMKKKKTKATPASPQQRIVVISSIGMQRGGSPPTTLPERIMSWLFMGPAKKAFRDLSNMEQAYHDTRPEDVDYLMVRPMGIGEDVVPQNKWSLQGDQKHSHDPATKLGMNMAKMDVARYMVQEGLAPTKHRTGVIIGGSVTPPPQSPSSKKASGKKSQKK